MADTIKKYVSLENLNKYDELLKAKMATDDASILAQAKQYCDDKDDQFEAAGSAATAESNAKSYTDTEVAKANSAASAAQSTADEAKAAAATADGKAVAAQEDVDNLATYVGTIPGTSAADTVIAYIQERTENIASSDSLENLASRVTDVESALDTIENDYLVEADKTELQGKIDAKVAQSDYDAKIEEIGGDIDGLQTQINTIMSNPDAEGAINSINEFTQYVADHGTIADGFRNDINKNKDDIAAEVKRAGEAETALAGRLDVLEDIDHDAYVAADTALKNELTTEIGKKADASALTSAVETLEGKDTELSGKISALEAKFGEGEGSVGSLIADAMDAEEVRVDGLLANKVDKVEGKGLSTNDLTDELKGQYDAAYAHSQVAHAPSNAQENLIESVKVNGTALTITDKAVDISVPVDNAELANGAGYLVASDIANKADKGTTLADYGIADAYTSAQTDEAIANAMAQFEECTQADIENLFVA